MSITAIMLSEGIDDISDLFDSPAPTPSAGAVPSYAGTSSVSSFWQLVGLVLLLIIILIAAYYVSRFVANLKMGQLSKSNFQVIDTYRISTNKFLQIVKIGKRYFVLAVGKDTITLVAELEEDEVMIREFSHGEKPNFKKLLEKFGNKNE